jgi:hypothetical protein
MAGAPASASRASQTVKPMAKFGSLTFLLLALAGCGSLDLPSRSTTLNSIEELKERFNQAKGKPRLILLMSPT